MKTITLVQEPNQTLPWGNEAENYRSKQDHPDRIVSDHESLSLSEGCVVYRDDSPGRKIVRFVALKSIESCCVQTSRGKPPLVVAAAMLLLASAVGLYLNLLPHAKLSLDFSQVFFPAGIQLKLRWIPLELLVVGTLFFLVYLLFHREELVIWTLSGHNQIRIPISSGFKNSIEPFVAGIRMHARNGRTEERVCKAT